MRMPNARQISEEQQDVFEDAPISGNILVSGPPGTGKTVIAFLRAQALANKSIDVTVLMYNRVLRRYTENVAEEIQGVSSKTMHTWLSKWWSDHQIELVEESDNDLQLELSPKVYFNISFSDKDKVKAAGGRWDPLVKKWYVSRADYEQDPIKFSQWPEFSPEGPIPEAGRIYLQTTFEDKDQVKLAGAKYDPTKRKWWVTQEHINLSPQTFEKWLGPNTSFKPPKLSEWEFDWEAMLDQYSELDEEDVLDWGHLILDEAQDFPPKMFRFLHGAGRSMDNGGVTILADENQRLQDGQNSTLDDIRSGLRIKPDREFRLTKNFRNTKPIAEFAKHFYTGLPTGVPETPDKAGGVPKLISATNQMSQVDYIHSYLQFRGALEVGVIVDSDSDRKFYLDKLTELLPNYSIQYYSSKEPKGSEDLIFDSQGVITILNRRSCKGLEFDTVFIPDLHKFSINDTDLTAFKMNMYVMCSRARSELVLMYVNDGASKTPILEHLPNANSGLIEYREI